MLAKIEVLPNPVEVAPPGGVTRPERRQVVSMGRFNREKGFDLNHNVVNCAFLMLGMTLHKSPVGYARAIAQSVRGVSGIVLQFPFYGGIFGMISKTPRGKSWRR